jgi:hypothetical protein
VARQEKPERPAVAATPVAEAAVAVVPKAVVTLVAVASWQQPAAMKCPE